MKKYKREQLIRRLAYIIFGSKIFSLPVIFRLRILVYRWLFNMERGAVVEHNVYISRAHGLEGIIKMGRDVVLARDVSIDYSGILGIGNDVRIGPGAMILTHHRDIGGDMSLNIQSPLFIDSGAYIGARAMILSSCDYICSDAVVAAGAVVTRDIVEPGVYAGVPAKKIK